MLSSSESLPSLEPRENNNNNNNNKRARVPRASERLKIDQTTTTKEHLHPNERGRQSLAYTETKISKNRNSRRFPTLSPTSPRLDPEFPPLIVPGTYPTLRIDEPVKEGDLGVFEFSLDIREDIYKKKFSEQRHYIWIGSNTPTKENTKPDHFVLSVLHEPTTINPPIFRGLKTSKRGTEEFELTIEDNNLRIFERISLAVKEKESDAELVYVKDCRKFSREFITLEHKHPQKLTEMKIGVIYCRPGQTHPQDMFKNGQGSDTLCPSFWQWVSLMGSEINLAGWEGYRGDMGNTGTAYYLEWNTTQNNMGHRIEIIYHLAPLLDAEGHRRLIGNDLAVIFFLEEGPSFQLSPLVVEALGTVPQTFVVVQPLGSRYRIGFLSYTNIKPFPPSPPTSSTVSAQKMKTLILTKLYNGSLLVSRFCPPMNRLFYVPRGETLELILEKYLPPNVLPKKMRKKEEARILEEKRKKAQPGESEFLRITVVVARIESDKNSSVCKTDNQWVDPSMVLQPHVGLPHPIVTLSLVGVQQKTKSVKHCSNPIWNEDFTFDLLASDKEYTDLKVYVHCNRTATFLGEVRIPLYSVLYLAGNSEDPQPHWFKLMKKKPEDREVSGEILLKFFLVSDQEARQQEQQPKTPRSFRKSNILSTSRSTRLKI